MKNKPCEMIVTFNSLDEIMAWIEHAKSMRYQPKSLRLSLQDVVFGLPSEGNSAIDAMVAKAAAAIDAQETLTQDDMRALFNQVASKRGRIYVMDTMARYGGTRINDIAETEWPALAAELRDA